MKAKKITPSDWFYEQARARVRPGIYTRCVVCAVEIQIGQQRSNPTCEACEIHSDSVIPATAFSPDRRLAE